MTAATRSGSANGIWPHVRRFGPVVVFALALVYVLARPRAVTGDEIPSYAVIEGTSPDSVVITRLRVKRGRDARFALTLRPKAPPATKIVAYAFATGGGPDAEANPVDVRFDVASDGVIRAAGTGRALEGATELRLVLGAPSAFVKFDDAAARAKGGQSDPFVQVTVLPIERE